MEWYESSLPMRPAYGLDSCNFDTMADMYHIQVEDDIQVKGWLECFATEILDAKYEWTDVTDVVQHMDHISQTYKDDILKVLQKNSSMFHGTLGVYPHKKFHIDVDTGSKPVYSWQYTVPLIHLSTFKKELYHIVDLGFLVHQNESEWVSTTFILPKNDGKIHWISNLFQLNKVIKRKKYTLPIITDILCKRIWYKLFTKIDICTQ